MNQDVAVFLITKEHERGTAKHPNFPQDVRDQILIVQEESGEACRAVVQFMHEGGTLEAVALELIQTAGVCIRMLKNLNLSKGELDGLFEKVGC